ncbi:MAG: hypothetical protein OXS28_17440 [Gammaproteobacteria bacterium]|nr:hypothetical protein [Gammaproteobacteria bacterium]MDE0157373.1 hypothetical protein [Gammaproteobacteria bacterium]
MKTHKSDDIANLYKIFEETVAGNDVDRLLAEFYSPDVTFVGTGLPLSQGPVVKDILGGLCGAVKSVRVEQLQTIIVEPSKVLIDFAIVHAKGADGTTTEDRSTCVFYNGPNGWRCVADIFIRD